MTFQQMYDLYETLWDKSGSPYLPKDQFDEIANLKYNDFVTEECKKIEEGIEHTVRIFQLYKNFHKQNSKQIDFPADVNDLRYGPVRLTMKYRKNCNGTITYPEVKVRKAPNNNVDDMQNDPFNRGIDADPTYTPSRVFSSPNTSWVINCDTVPLNLALTYIRFPQKINSFGAPGTVFELDDFVAEQIVRSVVFRGDIMIENGQRAQMEMVEQQEMKAQ